MSKETIVAAPAPELDTSKTVSAAELAPQGASPAQAHPPQGGGAGPISTVGRL